MLLLLFYFYMISMTNSEILTHYLKNKEAYLGRCFGGNNYAGVYIQYCSSPYCLSIEFNMELRNWPTHRPLPLYKKFFKSYFCGTPTAWQQRMFVESCTNTSMYSEEECQAGFDNLPVCRGPLIHHNENDTLKGMLAVCCEGLRCNRPPNTMGLYIPGVHRCNIKGVDCPTDPEAPLQILKYPTLRPPMYYLSRTVLTVVAIGVALLIVIPLYTFFNEKNMREKWISGMERAELMAKRFVQEPVTNFECAVSFHLMVTLDCRALNSEEWAAIMKYVRPMKPKLEENHRLIWSTERGILWRDLSKLFPRLMKKTTLFTPGKLDILYDDPSKVHDYVKRLGFILLRRKDSLEEKPLPRKKKRGSRRGHIGTFEDWLLEEESIHLINPQTSIQPLFAPKIGEDGQPLSPNLWQRAFSRIPRSSNLYRYNRMHPEQFYSPCPPRTVRSPAVRPRTIPNSASTTVNPVIAILSRIEESSEDEEVTEQPIRRVPSTRSSLSADSANLIVVTRLDETTAKSISLKEAGPSNQEQETMDDAEPAMKVEEQDLVKKIPEESRRLSWVEVDETASTSQSTQDNFDYSTWRWRGIQSSGQPEPRASMAVDRPITISMDALPTWLRPKATIEEDLAARKNFWKSAAPPPVRRKGKEQPQKGSQPVRSIKIQRSPDRPSGSNFIESSGNAMETKRIWSKQLPCTSTAIIRSPVKETSLIVGAEIATQQSMPSTSKHTRSFEELRESEETSKAQLHSTSTAQYDSDEPSTSYHTPSPFCAVEAVPKTKIEISTASHRRQKASKRLSRQTSSSEEDLQNVAAQERSGFDFSLPMPDILPSTSRQSQGFDESVGDLSAMFAKLVVREERKEERARQQPTKTLSEYGPEVLTLERIRELRAAVRAKMAAQGLYFSEDEEEEQGEEASDDEHSPKNPEDDRDGGAPGEQGVA